MKWQTFILPRIVGDVCIKSRQFALSEQWAIVVLSEVRSRRGRGGVQEEEDYHLSTILEREIDRGQEQERAGVQNVEGGRKWGKKQGKR